MRDGGATDIGSAPPITTDDVMMPEQTPAMRDRTAAQEYLDGMGAKITTGLSDAYQRFDALCPSDVAADPAAAGLAIRQQILVPLIELRRAARGYTPASDAVSVTHDTALAALDAALALQAEHLAAIEHSLTVLTEPKGAFDVWQERLEALQVMAGRR